MDELIKFMTNIFDTAKKDITKGGTIPVNEEFGNLLIKAFHSVKNSIDEMQKSIKNMDKSFSHDVINVERYTTSIDKKYENALAELEEKLDKLTKRVDALDGGVEPGPEPEPTPGPKPDIPDVSKVDPKLEDEFLEYLKVNYRSQYYDYKDNREYTDEIKELYIEFLIASEIAYIDPRYMDIFLEYLNEHYPEKYVEYITTQILTPDIFCIYIEFVEITWKDETKPDPTPIPGPKPSIPSIDKIDSRLEDQFLEYLKITNRSQYYEYKERRKVTPDILDSYIEFLITLGIVYIDSRYEDIFLEYLENNYPELYTEYMRTKNLTSKIYTAYVKFVNATWKGKSK